MFLDKITLHKSMDMHNILFSLYVCDPHTNKKVDINFFLNEISQYFCAYSL